LRIQVRQTLGEVRGAAWGEGAQWALDAMPGLLGALDDASQFDPRTPEVTRAWHQQPHWRFGRTDLLFESLLPSILEQKVTAQEAFSGFRRLVQRFGEPAPGPGGAEGLMLQPSSATVAKVPSWDWLEAGIGPARSSTAVRAARVASSLQRACAGGGEHLESALRSIPGIGVWTSAEVRQRVLGDPDAVSFGDYHVAKDLGWAVGQPGFTDDDMARYLEPWRPQRGRVVHLLRAAAGGRPRHGARMEPRRHLPVRRG